MADGEQAASGASALQLKIALMLQILLMLKGNGGVQLTNPGLGYNYKGATTAHGFAGTMGTQIAQQFIPGPLGALAAPLIGDVILQLIKPATSTLAWKNNFINPMGMSALGFSSSIEYRRKISDYLSKASQALNNAYRDYGGSKSLGGLNAWLLFIGLDLQKRKATLAAVLGSVAVLAARHGKDWGEANFNRATSGIAKAVASAATGGYYGNFGGLQIGILAQHLAAQGAFDADAADAANGALNIKNKLRSLSRALLPLRDIFGNDIKMLVASLLTLYGTGIGALGQGRLLQLAGDIRGTMYATGANMKAIALAKKSAALYRQAVSPGSSGNIVLNDINTALQYTMRTTQPQNSAFMTTDLYRTYAMADLVGSATSAYADTANKAFGMWAMKTGTADILQYKKKIALYMQNNRGATYELAMLGLAEVSTAAQLQKTSYSDWALRQGFGARMADTQNYDNRVALTLAAHTAWLSGDKARAVLQALYGNNPNGRDTARADIMLSTIYGLKDDADAFSQYMKSMDVNDAETQQVLYRMATDSRGGTPIAAMARARLVLKRTRALKATMDKMRGQVYGTQAKAGTGGEGVALGGATGLWALLNSGKVDKETATVALKTAGLDPNVFEMTANEQGQVTSIEMNLKGTAPGYAAFAKFFNSMTDALKGKFILSIPQNLDKFTGAGGSVDYVKALLYISGRGDTKLFIDKHIEDKALRAKFKDMLGEDRLKALKALLANKKKSGLPVSLALVALAANTEARTAVSQYKASLLLGNYKGVDRGALQKVQDYLKQGKTLDMLLKDTGVLASLMLDKNADGSISTEVSAEDKKQLLFIKTLISSQGKDQGLLFNLLQPIVGPLLLAVNKYIKTE